MIGGHACILVLRFQSPDVAQERYAAKNQVLEEETGWRIQIYSSAHQGAMKGTPRRALPSDATLVGSPSLHLTRKVIEVPLHGPLLEDQLEQARALVSEQTGWMLIVRVVP